MLDNKTGKRYNIKVIRNHTKQEKGKKKMTKTKKEMYTVIMNLADATDEIKEFCEKEIALLDKRTATGNSKKKAETAERAEKVFNALAEMEQPVTVGELIKLTSDAEVASYNSQRVTALIRSLGDRVKAETVKGRKYYTVV